MRDFELLVKACYHAYSLSSANKAGLLRLWTVIVTVLEVLRFPAYLHAASQSIVVVVGRGEETPHEHW